MESDTVTKSSRGPRSRRTFSNFQSNDKLNLIKVCSKSRNLRSNCTERAKLHDQKHNSNVKSKKSTIKTSGTRKMTVRNLMNLKESESVKTTSGQSSDGSNSRISVSCSENDNITTTEINLHSPVDDQLSNQGHASKNEDNKGDVDLRVTPDFDLASTNKEILDYIYKMRRGPGRRKSSSRRREIMRYMSNKATRSGEVKASTENLPPS
ncbi:Hypothetical protein SRAE_1000320300 [Strongyloides ratti]|uniref:Uncharacterized protein n=1 Tax=Strongyloides ratti TaxID=34506 RepID=A0A090LBN9_STRRB|nr:Hypothetical protein SRAE_1000320300 [Strongyloides ratti]CEF64950.1 Hypothetical protein SRAE_1000320300 [Strongyloides ratti]